MENSARVVPERFVGGELKLSQTIAKSTGTGTIHSLYCTHCMTTSQPAANVVEAYFSCGKPNSLNQGKAQGARSQHLGAFSRRRGFRSCKEDTAGSKMLCELG